MTNSSKEPKGYSEWIEEGKRLGFHDYWKEMTQLAVKGLRQQIIEEMNARRIDHKTYIDSEWLIGEYEKALHHSHKEELEQARREERERIVQFLKDNGEQAVQDLWYIHRTYFEKALTQ